MSDSKAGDKKPDAITNPAGGVGSYPLQIVFLLVVFALALGAYIYFTSGDDEAASSLGPRIEYSAARTA